MLKWLPGLLICSLCGCVTYSVTPTSFTRNEEIRREIIGSITNSGEESPITELEARGFECRIVRNGTFTAESGEVTGPFDFVLCEKPNAISVSATMQAAIVLNGDFVTEEVLVNSYVK